MIASIQASIALSKGLSRAKPAGQMQRVSVALTYSWQSLCYLRNGGFTACGNQIAAQALDIVRRGESCNGFLLVISLAI